ncbi:MAG: hypothetical protein JW828_15120 [Sedimentisphaerales bacterium]|nr:hypothetical protein [Sedimentisphaerales bacterium]
MAQSSPFESLHTQLGAHFGEFDQWRLPQHYGDSGAEKQALQAGCAAFDLSSFGRIQVRGASAEEAIRAVIGNGALPETGTWSTAVSDVGQNGVRRPVRIASTEKGYLILTCPADRHILRERLEQEVKHSGGGVKIVDQTEKTGMLGIYGPRTYTAIDSILPFDLSELEPGSVTEMSYLMITVTVLRGSWLAGDGLELICPASVAPMAAGAIVKYHQRQGIVPAGMLCLQEAMACL